MRTMKAIVNTGPGQLAWQDRTMPVPTAGQVRIRTSACGICATDLEMIKGWDRTGFPAIPGHEWSGVVDVVGPGVEASLVGRPCVAENVLADGGEVGFEHAGGYGQFLLTEAHNIRTLPQGFPMQEAALIEPLAVCVRAMRRLGLTQKRSALVLGDGVIGLLMLKLLKLAGVQQVVLVGGRSVRLELAKALGATDVINYHEQTKPLAQAVATSDTASFDNVLEASGSASAMELALQVAARGGKVLVIGDYGPARANFPWNHLLHRELELIGSNASAGAWDEAVQLAVSGTVPLGRLISRCVPASRFAEAVDLVRGNREIVKVVLNWSSEA